MRKICYVSSRLCKIAKKSFMYIKNSEKTHFGQFSNDTLLFYANRNKTEPREVTKQVVWIILRNRIFHRTIRHIRSGFPSYARTLCTLTLFAYALKGTHFYILFVVIAAGVVLCGSPKKQPRTSSIVQFIFFFLVL